MSRINHFLGRINHFLGRINHFLSRALGTLNAIAAVLLLIPVVSISSAWEAKLGYGVGFLVFMIGIIGTQYGGGFSIIVIRFDGPTMSTPHLNTSGVKVRPTRVAYPP